MDIINSLLVPVSWPTSGAWEAIISWFMGVGNIAIAIILLTICLKIVLLPLDFWQKMVTRKMTAQQALIQPELEEIKKKYANNQQLLQQKQAELYKKNNVSPTNSCLAMLVYMVVTMIVFFTLFSSLGNISKTQINYEYYQLEQEYRTVYNATGDETQAIASVTEKYDEIRVGFLSIKNIWRPDNWSSVFPKSDEFVSNTKTGFNIYEYETAGISYVYLTTNAELHTDAAEKQYVEPYVDLAGNIYVVKAESDATTAEIGGTTYNIVYGIANENYETNSDAAAGLALEQFKADFTKVTAGINEKYEGQWNGFLVLIVLSGVITFLSSWLATLGVKTRDNKGNEVKGAKPKPTMGIILAVVMIMFTFSYTSLFALYIITNSIMSTILTFVVNIIINKLELKKSKKDVKIADYVRR